MNNDNMNNRSDSISSTDSEDDNDLIKAFLNQQDFDDSMTDELQQLIDKENIIKFLKELLKDSQSHKQNRIQQKSTNELFEINQQKSSLNLDESLDTDPKPDLLNGLPTNLIVTSVTDEVFCNNEARTKFEKLFLDLDDKCKFCHFRIFKRCTVQFSDPIAAILARIQYNNQIFLGENLKMFLSNPIKLKNSRQYLEAPKNEKTFLISPPSSPPVGWTQVIEDPPVVNLELLATLSTKLNPLEPCELIKSNNDMPGIIIHPCADSQEFFETNDNMKRKFMPTRRPANDFN